MMIKDQERVDVKLMDIETRLFDAVNQRDRYFQDKAIRTAQTNRKYEAQCQKNKTKVILEDTEKRKKTLIDKELKSTKFLKNQRKKLASIKAEIKSRNIKNEEKVQGNLKTQEILHSDFLESTIQKHINKEKYLTTLSARRAVSPDAKLARQRENFNQVEKTRKSFAILTLLRRKMKNKANEAKESNNMMMYKRDLQKSQILRENGI